MFVHFEELIRRRSELTPQMIEDVLAAYGINTEGWGKAPSKSVHELTRLLGHEEAYLMHDTKSIILFEKVVIVTVRINRPEGPMVLIESKRVFPDGTVQVRSLPGSLSEKEARVEERIKTAVRGLKEELELESIDLTNLKATPFKATPRGRDEEPVETASFPGLKVIHSRSFYEYAMPEHQFKEEYKETTTSGRTTYFNWIKA